MKLPIFQIDAFSDTVFGGNPACVVRLENWLEDDVLLKIAQENAVAETAFFIKKEKLSFKVVHARHRNGFMWTCYFGYSTLYSF